MPVTSEQYRDALRHYPAGVTIVSIRAGEEIHGLTVSAFASVSPEPPLIAVVIDHRHNAAPILEQPAAVFAVNVLGEDQVEMSNRFAFIKDEDRFRAGRWGTAVTGAPILLDSLAWLDCRIHSRLPAGTHTIYVGEVEATGLPNPDGPPLVYWNRGYRKLTLHGEPDDT